MHAARRPLPALLGALVLALVLAGPASAAVKVPGSFVIKQKLARLQVDTAGFVEVTRLHDTTSDCFPGEHWVQTNDFTFETGTFVNVYVKNVSAPGVDPVVTSPLSRTAGSAVTRGRISDYRTTNHCAPTPPAAVKPAPVCRTNRGRTRVALTPGRPKDTSGEDLAPLSGTPLLLSIYRAGGGVNSTECAGGGASNLSGTDDLDTAVIGTSIGPGIADVLPAKLDAIKLFSLRAGRRVRRVTTAWGPCSAVTVRVATSGSGATPPPAKVNADGDCFLRAKVVLTIRARTR